MSDGNEDLTRIPVDAPDTTMEVRTVCWLLTFRELYHIVVMLTMLNV